MSSATLFDPCAYWIGMCTKINSMDKELKSIKDNTALPPQLREQANDAQMSLLILEGTIQLELARLKQKSSSLVPAQRLIRGQSNDINPICI